MGGVSISKVIASLPSPSFNGIDVGPFRFNIYGICIALGVIAAIILLRGRFEKRGGDGSAIERIAIAGVVAGVLGARFGYVLTHLDQMDPWYRAFMIWEGGLAFFGGLTAGAAMIIFLLRRGNMSVLDGADAIAPALPLAQAIGRWGNYFNQELYGKPTDLPWGLEIAPEHRVRGFSEFETFHPTFLYESLLNLVLVGFILWVDRRFAYRRGSLFFIYLAGYGLIRFGMELLRIDTSFRLAGLSRNGWIALLIAAGGTIAWFRANRPSQAEDATASRQTST